MVAAIGAFRTRDARCLAGALAALAVDRAAPRAAAGLPRAGPPSRRRAAREALSASPSVPRSGRGAARVSRGVAMNRVESPHGVPPASLFCRIASGRAQPAGAPRTAGRRAGLPASGGVCVILGFGIDVCGIGGWRSRSRAAASGLWDARAVRAGAALLAHRIDRATALAGRFAAKEAVVKAMAGAPGVRLARPGGARRAARRRRRWRSTARRATLAERMGVERVHCRSLTTPASRRRW